MEARRDFAKFNGEEEEEINCCIDDEVKGVRDEVKEVLKDMAGGKNEGKWINKRELYNNMIQLHRLGAEVIPNTGAYNMYYNITYLGIYGDVGM